MDRRLTCFLSFPYGRQRSESIMDNVVIPVLIKLQIEPVIARDVIEPDKNIYDVIISKIRRSDFFLCDLTEQNHNMTYELGIAHAWGKPSLILSQKIEQVPMDLVNHYPTIFYKFGKDWAHILEEQLFSQFKELIKNRYIFYDPTINRYIDKKSTITFQFAGRRLNPIGAFNFINQSLILFQEVGDSGPFEIEEVKVGSLETIISAPVESIARLLEKIIFFIPEWRLKDAERLKINAETQRILAEVEHIKVETTEKERETIRKDANTFLEILKKAHDLGSTRIVFGQHLVIEANKDGQIKIDRPK